MKTVLDVVWIVGVVMYFSIVFSDSVEIKTKVGLTGVPFINGATNLARD